MRTNATPSPSASSPFPSVPVCFSYHFSYVNFTSFSVVNVLLLLPVCALVLSFAVLRRWRKQTASHSDIFTYHMVVVEMVGVFGCGSYLCGVGLGVPWMSKTGLYLFSVTTYGQILFHTLTCGERYLAVVHPIVYLGLRTVGGVRLRDASVGCVWLLFLSSFGLTSLAGDFNAVAILCVLLLATAAVSFCSLAVLCALTRQGPGDGVGDRPRADRSKTRACHTIAAILGALMIRVGGHLIVVGFYSSAAWSETIRCAVLVSGIWFCLPSSLVLPLLFLHRATVLRRRGRTGAESRSQ